MSDRSSTCNTSNGAVITMVQERLSSRWIDNLTRRRALKIGGGGAVAVAAGWLVSTASPINAQEATPVAATPTGCPELTLDEKKALAQQFFPAWEGVVKNPSALAA